MLTEANSYQHSGKQEVVLFPSLFFYLLVLLIISIHKIVLGKATGTFLGNFSAMQGKISFALSVLVVLNSQE